MAWHDYKRYRIDININRIDDGRLEGGVGSPMLITECPLGKKPDECNFSDCDEYRRDWMGNGQFIGTCHGMGNPCGHTGKVLTEEEIQAILDIINKRDNWQSSMYKT